MFFFVFGGPVGGVDVPRGGFFSPTASSNLPPLLLSLKPPPGAPTPQPGPSKLKQNKTENKTKNKKTTV